MCAAVSSVDVYAILGVCRWKKDRADGCVDPPQSQLPPIAVQALSALLPYGLNESFRLIYTCKIDRQTDSKRHLRTLITARLPRHLAI